MKSKKQISHYEIPKGKQEERLVGMLRQLGLDDMALNLKEQHTYALANQKTMLDFFESLLEKQVSSREENRVTRWRQLARFPARKTLLDFDFSYQPSINKSQINELASCRYIDNGENIFFIGQPGVGKTHLSIALGEEAINQGYDTRFLTLDKLIDDVEKTDIETSPTLLRNLIKPRLLILDDMDFYNTGKIASEFLFKLVVGRYDNGNSTILTSNKKPSEWGELFGKERASAALDRLIEKAIPIIINGESFRMRSKQAKKIGV